MTHPLTPREKVKLQPSFGDVIENGWASDANPTRIGFFVREFTRTGRLNPGVTWEITDGKGKFWEFKPKDISEGGRLKVTSRTALASGSGDQLSGNPGILKSGDHAELARLKAAMSKSNDEICQSLGKALGYPWFKDDQRNFPGATEGNGVCVGDHVAESIADEAASRISALLAENAALRAESENARTVVAWANNSLFGSCGYFHGDPFDGLHLARPIEALKEQATEAERKLAEAVGVVEWYGENARLARLIHSEGDAGRSALADDGGKRARAFLSKEAERG